MAYLLGSKACMESLHNDVQDVQWAINDVFSRTGPVAFPSWKFPDKKSCDLDIDDLLEMYDYSEDEEERQVAHIALYELVIDRMVLLIQSMAKYTEQLMTGMKTGGDNSSSCSSSVGLVVKKYWNRLIQLHTVVQQTQSENKSKNHKFSDLENTVSKLRDELSQYKNDNGTSYQRGLTPPKTPGFGGLIPPNNAELALMRGESVLSSEVDISRDACNKSSQTIETVFVPCESCHAVQKCLREGGDVIINTCQSQNLPSSLKMFRAQLVDIEWLSFNDVKRWTVEQNKDIARMNKHVEQLASTIGPLQQDVAGYLKEKRKMTEKVEKAEKDLKLERETQTAVRQQFEVKVSELEKRHAEMLGHVTREKEELQAARSGLENMLTELKEQLGKQKQELQELESTKQSLQSEVDRNKVTSSEVSALETEVNNYKTQLEQVNDKLGKANQDLTKEQAKNKSVAKHGQSLQTKQDSLLQRIGELDQENQELRDEVSALEEEKESIEESLTAAQSEVKELTGKIKEKETVIASLDTEKASLKQQISETESMIERLEKSLEEAKERERMIVEYPDLNGPVNPDYQGTGDIVTDMESQVKANCVRIQVLEDQNVGLRNSITKMLQVTQTKPQSRQQELSGPAPLWNKESLSRYKEEYVHQDTYSYARENMNNNSTSKSVTPERLPTKTAVLPKEQTFSLEKSKTKTDSEFLIGKTSRPNSASRLKDGTKQGRPPSGKGNPGRVMAPVNTTSISAYIQMKKSGHLGSQGASAKPPSGKPSRRTSGGDNSAYFPPDIFVCQNCDKMYSKERDLEIHRSYCTGH